MLIHDENSKILMRKTAKVTRLMVISVWAFSTGEKGDIESPHSASTSTGIGLKKKQALARCDLIRQF